MCEKDVVFIMKLIEKEEKVVLIDDDGNVVIPTDPAAIDYIIDRYNACVKYIHRIEDELKTAGVGSVDQLNSVTDPDNDTINFFNSLTYGGRKIKPRPYSPMLHMIRDNYEATQKESDLVRKYISENNIDYTLDENGFIAKKDQERK